MASKATGLDPMHVFRMMDGHTHHLYATPWVENPGCNCAGSHRSWWHRVLTVLGMRRPESPVCGGHSRTNGRGTSKVELDALIATVLEHYSHA